MSSKKVIKMFGQREVAAMIKELSQLDRGAIDRKPVVIPIDSKLLSPENKKKVLDAVHLIKEKGKGQQKA